MQLAGRDDGHRFDHIGEVAPGHVVLHLLRPREWAERHGAREGESIELALRELNIEGSARVTSVQRAPALSAGSRCLVTGTIRRSGVSVIVVELELGAPMELTANHRVFSATRNGWVAAGDLLAGEALQAQEGTVPVRSVHASEQGLTTVFNLEVFARHEFFVGEARVRVHNGYSSTSSRLLRGRENIFIFETLREARTAAREFAGIDAHVAAMAVIKTPVTVEKAVSAVGPSSGLFVGSRTSDGHCGWRIDLDPTKGFHVNWWNYTGGRNNRRNWLYGANIVQGGTKADYLALLQHYQ